MSRKSAYKQVLSIGTAMVLGFALFTGSLDGAPKLLSPQSDEQAAALAEKQTRVPAAPTTRRTWSLASSRVQPVRRTPTLTLNPTTTRQRTPPPPYPSTKSKTPTSSAPVAYISPASPTTPATLRCPSRRQHALARHAVVYARRVRAGDRRGLL